MSEEATDPSGAGHESTLQAWAKPLPLEFSTMTAAALLLINPTPNVTAFDVPIGAVPFGVNSSVALVDIAVRDIWARADRPIIPSGATSVSVKVDGYSSAFLKLTPSASEA